MGRTAGTLLAALVGTAGACSDQIVYRDRESAFEPPPTAAADFLGYSNVDAKRTTCGNCHAGKQAQWQQTAHASAWYTLRNSGTAGPACEGCHSVSSLGNSLTTENVGWAATKSTRYQDVQCESCHGPGLKHVINPDLPSNRPLASLAVATTPARGCAECHSGSHRPFAEEWGGSRHARVVVSRATNASCVGCHEAKGILLAWGIKSTFVEESAPNEHMAVTCTVCHDPHDKRNPAQLRFRMDVPALEANLCMKCHYRRAQPEVASSSGPHSPQGPLLLGEAGWVPPNFQYPPGSLVGSHGTDRNPKLCATCHVSSYVLNDPRTGALSFRATGHSFQATPCVNTTTGVPTGAATCEDTQRSFRACTSCHLTEGAARTALSVARLRLARLAEEVAALIPRIPASEFSTTDNRISTGEGARFNMQLAQERGSAAHNPFLVEALLLASIKQIEIDYRIRPSATLAIEPQLAPR
jgi:predicted CXXCH cytochrome family protein